MSQPQQAKQALARQRGVITLLHADTLCMVVPQKADASSGHALKYTMSNR